MARRRNLKGHCDERSIEVYELNLCDRYKGKRKRNKPLCRNCVYFQLTEPLLTKKQRDQRAKQEKKISDDDV